MLYVFFLFFSFYNLIYLFKYLLTLVLRFWFASHYPPLNCVPDRMVRVFANGTGRPGFDLESNHTKDSKNDT